MGSPLGETEGKPHHDGSSVYKAEMRKMREGCPRAERQAGANTCMQGRAWPKPIWDTGSHPASVCADINYTTKKRSKWVGAKVTSTRGAVAVVRDHRPPQADSARFCVIRG